MTAVSLLLIAAVPAVRDAVYDIGGQNLHVRVFGDAGTTIVFEAGLGEDMDTWKTLMAQQRQLSRLSPRGRLIVAAGSGHFVQLDRPGLVVRVMQKVVVETRH